MYNIPRSRDWILLLLRTLSFYPARGTNSLKSQHPFTTGTLIIASALQNLICPHKIASANMPDKILVYRCTGENCIAGEAEILLSSLEPEKGE